MYKISFPINWDIPTEQPAPMWYGTISLMFSLPVPQQQFNMEEWTMPNTLNPEYPLVGDVHT
jgi:hypothetical protein